MAPAGNPPLSNASISGTPDATRGTIVRCRGDNAPGTRCASASSICLRTEPTATNELSLRLIFAHLRSDCKLNQKFLFAAAYEGEMNENITAIRMSTANPAMAVSDRYAPPRTRLSVLHCSGMVVSFLFALIYKGAGGREDAAGKVNAPRGRVYMILVAPQGFEPRSSESESLVLPLNEGALQAWCLCGVREDRDHRQLPFRVYERTRLGSNEDTVLRRTEAFSRSVSKMGIKS